MLEKNGREDFVCLRIKELEKGALDEILEEYPLHYTPDNLVLDLGCGMGVTSLFIANETGATVYANDLWISEEENRKCLMLCLALIHIIILWEKKVFCQQYITLHKEGRNCAYSDSGYEK